MADDRSPSEPRHRRERDADPAGERRPVDDALPRRELDDLFPDLGSHLPTRPAAPRPPRGPLEPRTLYASARRFTLAAVLVAALAFALPLLGLPTGVVERLQWLLPLVFGLTVLIDWLDEAAMERPWLDRVAGKLFDLWGEAGAGFYGIMSVATFVRLETGTIIDEFVTAGSIEDFLRGEGVEILLGFSIQSILNLLQAAVWFFPWISGTPWHIAAVAIALCYGAYAAGRWSWVEGEEPTSSAHDE